jgi:membrane fusion protein (multidrug efflux system)
MQFCRRSWTMLLVLIVLLAGCSRQQPDASAPTLVAPVQDWQGDASVRATGRVVLVHQADLSFPLSGQIVSWSVKEGDSVHQGDVLVRLDTTILEDEVAQSEAALAVAQANLDAAVARTDPALMDLPGSAAIARAEVAHSQTVVDEAKALLAQATLVAPMDGVVTAIYVNQYEFAPEGKPVAQLSDMSAMQVTAELGEPDMVGIAVGNTATVTFDSAPGVEVQGQVTSITPKFTSGDSPKFIVVVGLNEIPQAVHWGMTANVLISTQ